MQKQRINIIIFFTVCLLFSGCDQSRVSTNGEGKLVHKDVSDVPDREGWDAVIRISSEGRLKAVIEYGHMTYFDKNKINYFNQGVKVDMFDKHGKHTTKLTAEKGEYHELTQDIWAIGQVVVISDTGVILFTPIGRWDQHLEKIISDTSVMVTTIENDTIYGTAFQSDADLSHMIIENPRGTREEGVDFESWEREVAKPIPADSMEPL
ncbi:LPS export ABC transporter periplasmic protein LptC [bacterium]|nr:LPS export ABC transporter periplasmic protein LptC [bacterium]